MLREYLELRSALLELTITITRQELAPSVQSMIAVRLRFPPVAKIAVPSLSIYCAYINYMFERLRTHLHVTCLLIKLFFEDNSLLKKIRVDTAE